jgi:prepilin-type N-terminal cleavage/methylation domain-containing protein/prepilin-type processing-associated H-X9-DG protein
MAGQKWHLARMVPDRSAVFSQPGRSLRSLVRRDGFSLIELLIVMALIIIMTTLYLSSGSQAYQARKRIECEGRLQHIYIALKTFAVDANDRLPLLPDARTSEAPLSQLVPRYTTGAEFFTCPGSKDAPLPDAQPFANRKISYAYYMGRTILDGADVPLVTDRQVNTKPKLAGEPLFSADGSPPGNNHNRYGGNLMFCDGSVQYSPPASAFVLTNAPNVILLNPKP